MLLPPEPKAQIGVLARQLSATMQAGMTATAQRDLVRRPIRPRPTMVHDQSLTRQADLAAAVPGENRFAVPAEETPGMPAPVVTPSAESGRDEGRRPAGPAPPGGLRHLPAPGWFRGGSVPCPAAPDKTRIHSSGKPFATEASNRVRSSQAESRSPVAGRSQPGWCEIPGSRTARKHSAMMK